MAPDTAAPPVEVSTVDGAEPATDKPTNQEEESDMAYKIQCPVCEDKFKQPQGLHGHLRFSHKLEGDELQEVYQRAQNEDHFDFTDEEDAEGEAEEEAETGGSELLDLPSVDDEEAVSEAFDWEARLDRMEDLRGELDRLDRSTGAFEYASESRSAGVITGFFGRTRDEGVEEARDALNEIEMEVRERLGASEQDRQLRKRVDASLEWVDALVRCREQRETINERFDGEEADRRVERLDQKETELRKRIRETWDAGKPTEALDQSDPVRQVESS